MHRYFIHLAYNGTRYHGWQIQPNGISVQQELQKALSLLLREKIEVVGCGRTDTGVHASDFYAHFDIEKLLNQLELYTLKQKLNSFLKEDISILDVFKVKPDAHTRFDAITRTYQYHICIEKMPFRSNFVHHVYYTPDLVLMNEGARLLLGQKDFSCFSKLHTQTNNNICTIHYAHWNRKGDEFVFTIQANRFLRNMVRAIVGTLLDIGRGKITLQELDAIIESKNRSNAGTSVPGKALFLTKVEYPESIYFKE